MSLEQVNKYIELRRAGLKTSQIAAEIGVSTAAVHRFNRFIGIHGEHILRELPNLVLERPLKDLDYAGMVEWAIQNNWSCDGGSLLFMVSRKKFASFYKTRLEQGKPLLGADPIDPPCWVSLTGAFDVSKSPEVVPSLDDLMLYKQDAIPETTKCAETVSSCSYQDKHEVQPKPIDRKIGRAKAEVKITQPAKVMRSKAQLAKKRQEKALAALNDNLEILEQSDEPAPIASPKVKAKALKKANEATQVLEGMSCPKRGRPCIVDHNSPGFDDLPAEKKVKLLSRALKVKEAENEALKKSIVSIQY